MAKALPDNSRCNNSRVSVRLPEEYIKQIDALVEQGRYPNRSEAIRDGVREIVDLSAMGDSDAMSQ